MRRSRLVVLVAVMLLAVAGVASGAVLSAPAVAQAPAGSGLCDSEGVAQFSDVGDADYAAAYILCMRALGLSQGRSGGDYGPDRGLNRGQMASFLIRLWTDQLGQQCPTDVVVPFTDTAGTTHEANIECLFGLGITQGTSATAYSPQDPLKASQISRFLYRTYQKAGGGGDQCQTTAGSELDRASECLFSLRVVPSTDEATSASPVIRSQMGVYVIGLWHNLTGKGLPPTPPDLPTTLPPTTTTTTTRPAVVAEPYVIDTGDTGGVWVTNADGTGAERVASAVLGWSWVWSPDGARIAYMSGTGMSETGLWVVGADGTNARQIASDTGAPVWSPDGSRIAYHIERARELWVVGADGTGARRLASNVQSFDVRWGWSPDGSRIAYTSETGSEELGLWVVGADGAGAKQLGSDRVGSLVWSPDGTRVAYETYPSYELWVVGADGAGAKQLASSVWSYWAWSPDGSRIAYTDNDAGGLWVVGADGTGAKQIASNDSGTAKSPVWSPDGSRVFYAVYGRLWVVGADGTGAEEISSHAGGGAWSPDGSRIAYEVGYGGDEGLWVMGADGTGAKQIAPDGSSLQARWPDGVWSPDGSRIAYTVHEPEEEGVVGELWVVDADGANRWQVAVATYDTEVFGVAREFSRVGWSPDGTQLAFAVNVWFPGVG